MNHVEKKLQVKNKLSKQDMKIIESLKNMKKG